MSNESRCVSVQANKSYLETLSLKSGNESLLAKPPTLRQAHFSEVESVSWPPPTLSYFGATLRPDLARSPPPAAPPERAAS